MLKFQCHQISFLSRYRGVRWRHTNVWDGITFQLERAYEDGPGRRLFEVQLSERCEQMLIEMSSGMQWFIVFCKGL